MSFSSIVGALAEAVTVARPPAPSEVRVLPSSTSDGAQTREQLDEHAARLERAEGRLIDLQSDVSTRLNSIERSLESIDLSLQGGRKLERKLNLLIALAAAALIASITALTR